MLKPLRVVFGVVLFWLFVGPTLAQTVDTAWVRRYNGPGNYVDRAQAIAVDDSGNVYVTGYSWGSGTYEDYATIKYNPNGDTAWVRRYNGPGEYDDEASAMAVDDSGNVYVTGGSYDLVAFAAYTTVRYSPNGDTVWVRRYYGPDSIGQASAIVVDDSGNVYVTGESWSAATGKDYGTLKYHPGGDTAWVRRYNGPGDYDDQPSAMAVDDSGNVYVTGGSGISGIDDDYATVKYYPNGDTAWVRRYNGPADSTDRGSAIAVDDSGNVYVTGASSGIGTCRDYATIKYYPNGDTAWVRRYNRPGNYDDLATAVTVSGLDYVYVTGRASAEGPSDYTTIRYRRTGDTAWVARYSGPDTAWDGAFAMAVDYSGNVYVTGVGTGSGGGLDYVTIKYDTLGNELWVQRYNGQGNGMDQAFAIAVDNSGNVYVTGYSVGSGTDFDYVTIKYIQTGNYVQDETGSRERPSEFDLSQNYPNPFNPTTKIEFTLAKSGFVTLQIYDVRGRKVRTLVSEELSSGYKSVLWDGKNEAGKDVASGVYFYQLKVGDFSEPKKMLLLK